MRRQDTWKGGEAIGLSLSLFWKARASCCSILCSLLILFLIALFSEPSSLGASPQNGQNSLSDKSLRQSLALVTVSPIEYDPLRPWSRQAKKNYTTLGIVLSGGYLLAFAGEMERAAYVELRNYSMDRAYRAKVETIHREANLALLSVPDRRFFDNLVPMPFGEDPLPRQMATVVWIDRSFEVFRERLRIQRVKALTSSGFTWLPYHILRPRESLKHAGILLCGRGLCGFFSSAAKGSYIASLPPSLLRSLRPRSASRQPLGKRGIDEQAYGQAARFSCIASRLGAGGPSPPAICPARRDERSSPDAGISERSSIAGGMSDQPLAPQTGPSPSSPLPFQDARPDCCFVSQGFHLGRMSDPALRSHFALPDSLQGALVTRLFVGTSAWGVLQKDDIILSIDGVDLDNRGFYGDPIDGRQPAELLLARGADGLRRPGETVEMQVFRQGRSIQLQMPLKVYDGSAERIPLKPDQPPDYLIESGFLFLELSVPLLKSRYGNQWRRRALHAAYLFKKRRFYTDPSEDDRIVLLERVLPDPVNRGLEDMQFLVVQKLEGKRVSGLRQMYLSLNSLIRSGKDAALLELYGGQRIYLDLRQRDRISQRLLQRYGIPKASSFE